MSQAAIRAEIDEDDNDFFIRLYAHTEENGDVLLAEWPESFTEQIIDWIAAWKNANIPFKVSGEACELLFARCDKPAETKKIRELLREPE